MEELKTCPFCGGKVVILVCDSEGNKHDEDYELDPWSGLGYILHHYEGSGTCMCPIEGSDLGIWIYDTKEEAVKVWNRREV